MYHRFISYLKILLSQLSEDQDMKGASGRRSQSPLDPSQYFHSIDNQRGTPVGASDDESSSRSNGTPHSVVQISDDSISINDTYLKRGDNLQGTLNTYLIFIFILIRFGLVTIVIPTVCTVNYTNYLKLVNCFISATYYLPLYLKALTTYIFFILGLCVLI